MPLDRRLGGGVAVLRQRVGGTSLLRWRPGNQTEPGGTGHMAKQVMTSSLMPLYLQVVGNIKYAIDSGKYKVGDKIPTEAELGEQYGVSRITVRRAVSELVEAGYLVKQQGRGTFVKSSRDLMMVQHRTDLEVQSFSEACRNSGYAPGSIETEHGVREAAPDECAFLGLSEGGVRVPRRCEARRHFAVQAD